MAACETAAVRRVSRGAVAGRGAANKAPGMARGVVSYSRRLAFQVPVPSQPQRAPTGLRRRNFGSGPAEFLHGPAGVPDFRHVPDLVASEFHDIDVVRRRALAGRRTGTTLSGMGGGEHAIGANAVAVIVCCER